MENVSYFTQKMCKNLYIQENSKLLGEKTVSHLFCKKNTSTGQISMIYIMHELHHFLNLKGEAYFSPEKIVHITYTLPSFCGFRPFHLNYTNDAKNFMGTQREFEIGGME